MRLDAQLKCNGTEGAIVIADFKEQVVELQADLQVATEVFGVGQTELVFVVFQ